MNKTISNQIIFIIILIGVYSCNSRPFDKTDFTENEIKLYCYSIPHDTLFHEPNQFRERFPNFYIDDEITLRLIKEEVIKEKSNKQQHASNFIIFRLEDEKEIVDGGILDIDNGEYLYHNGKYNFDLEKFKSFQNKFKKLDAYEINCKTISNTKKLLDFVDKNDGFNYNNTKKEKHPILYFNGKVELLSDKSSLDLENTNGWKDIEKHIIDDFRKLGKIKIKHYSALSPDSIFITILVQQDISNSLPVGYKLFKNYTDTTDVPVRVYDISENQIVDFFEQNSIKDYEIKDLNKKTIGNKL